MAFLDGYTLLIRAAAAWQRPLGALFAHPFHPGIVASRILGLLLAERLHALRREARISFRTGLAPAFRYIGVADFAPSGWLVDRRSILISETLVRLSGGRRISLGLPHRATVVGIVLNTTETNAALLLVGAEMRIKRLDSHRFAPGTRPMLAVWSLIAPVRPKDGQIELRCLGVTGGPEPERNDHNAPDGPSCDYANPVVEFAGLIVMEPDMEAGSIASIGGFNRDLATGVDAAIATPAETRVL